MKHGDIEFHNLNGPVIDSIANEGLRIAKENDWKGLFIEIDISEPKPGARPVSVALLHVSSEGPAPGNHSVCWSPCRPQ